MSTRVPSLVDAPHIDASVKKEMPFATTDWKFLKSRLVDGVFVGMILVSILGSPTEVLLDIPFYRTH
jgi:hypothetical protein